MKERLPWFRCFPSALLGAMAGMTPEEGYTYVAVLLRIYETGGPVAETTRTLSRRTGLSERKVKEALESLIAAGKVRPCEDGRLDSDSTHDEIAWQQQSRENNSKAGKSSAAKRSANKANVSAKTADEGEWQKTQQNQPRDATRVERPLNHKEEEIEHREPPVPNVLEDKSSRTFCAERPNGARAAQPDLGLEDAKARYPPEFEELWQEYPASPDGNRRNKPAAFKAWGRLNRRDRERCFLGASRFAVVTRQERERWPERQVPYLQKFINGRQFDEYAEELESEP